MTEKKKAEPGEVVLSVEGLRYTDAEKVERLKGVDLTVRAGEIAGEVCLVVNGKEAARTYLVWGGSAGQDVLEKTARRSPLALLRSLTGRETAATLGPVRMPIG